ncbi:DUF4229 domain-containing protein [Arsenicicoccus sp. oral taxon 190]|uniref:DUF4229 domain-containing protein n=1 Tax=Arsenicicoccus sp. oral taxon 190 TaxID=1658671 RepID=UPI00067A0A1D|nr:DUF4229 domain-containing protein [Arsenicicoccus sp. oral taxon 190]AKT51201.1 hypothetical protein ADJ73_07555 [Arsenicicoccus sp. oral taxon 190]
MNPGLRYSLLRLLLFFGCLIALWLVGLRGIALVVAAGLLSMVVSVWTLRGPREEFSARIASRVDERAARAEERGAHRVSDEEAEEAELRRQAPGSDRGGEPEARGRDTGRP